jgi:hypothetical protein
MGEIMNKFFSLGATLLLATGALAGCASPMNNNAVQSNTNETAATAQQPDDPMACVGLRNISNTIKLHQPSFAGEPNPTDIGVYARFAITNSCDKAVSGLKGSLSFQNVVGDEIFTGNFTSDLTIPVGKTVNTSPTLGYTFNQFEDAYGALSATDGAKAHALLTLDKIVFDDGTSLSK